MVNKYKRKTTNASWDEETMKLAMEESKKTSVNTAAKIYGINLSTLQRHLKKGSAKKNPWKICKTAGEDWYVGKVRHCDITLRRPEPTSVAHARGFNRPQVERFFDLLEQ
ncbi:unnamed protein product [Euphydryas editha]|uniref:HTH psq-type domain-containing protein n=1 Tax=Euphydryas editha TaxID=104508 RepID=A0AAU9UUN4_EUPED|nr:unnamed protein product [Euphydryas editha]